MSVSIRNALWAGDASPKAWPRDTLSTSRSLRTACEDALRSLRSPRIEEWKIVSRRELANAKCSRRVNGIAFDGSSWFIASNGTGDAFEGGGLYKIDIRDMGLVYADFPTSGVHFGGMDFYGGYLYVAAGERDIWVVDAALKSPRRFRLPAEGHPGPDLPWCSINPLNGLLYTSPFNGVDQLYAYDPADGFAYCGSLKLKHAPFGGVQGACFTSAGHVYLISDTFEHAYPMNPTGHLMAFSSVTGDFLGALPLPNDPSVLEQEEAEDLVMATISYDGHTAALHLLINDNDLGPDDMQIVAYEPPDLLVV